MFKFFNPNPEGRSVGDCVIRAITKATDKSWDQVYIELCLQGFIFCDLPSANSVWGAYLRRQGFIKYLIPDYCPECYTVEDFAKDYNKGTFILGTGEHVVTVVDGDYYDSWDSGREVPIYYFKR